MATMFLTGMEHFRLYCAGEDHYVEGFSQDLLNFEISGQKNSKNLDGSSL